MCFFFSIITVCYNAQDNIENTFRSLYEQTMPQNIELVVVDGNSTDKTNDLIREWIPKFEKRGIKVSYISEKDRGIYDAMNKGILLSKGKYLYFLNCGDKFASKDVLSNIRIKIEQEKLQADIYFGNAILTLKDSVIKKMYSDRTVNKWLFLKGDMIVHQTIFAARKTLQSHLFDSSMALCADREWLMYCYLKKYKIEHIDIDVCYYDLCGKSNDFDIENRKKLRKETDMCLRRYMPILATLLYPIKKLKRAIAP